jgi:hypothetical protein
VLLLFSFLYFVSTPLHAWSKPFWFDELSSIYICRLPSFQASWQAVLHGGDFNPPLFYVIERAVQALFGENRVGLRLPEMFAFWLFSVCLFRFARRHMGRLAGWIALFLPTLSGGYYYATEARPHALVLGALGVALVCWQEWEDKPWSRAWTAAFAGALLTGFLLHCYAVLLAVPFGATELWRTVRTRNWRWQRWLALVLPVAIAGVCYWPLVSSFRATMGSLDISDSPGFGASFLRLAPFYGFVFVPCIGILLLVLLAAAWGVRSRRDALRRPFVPESELVLIACFVLFPLFGILFAKVSHGPFVFRYFLGSLAGCVLCLAYAASNLTNVRGRQLVALAVAVQLAWSAGQVWFFHLEKKAESIVEPSLSFGFSTYPDGPLAGYPLLRAQFTNNLPVAVEDRMDMLYLLYYAPPALRSRLFLVTSSERDVTYRLYRALRQWAGVPSNPESTLDQFVAAHRKFVFYGLPSGALVGDLQTRLNANLRNVRFGDQSKVVAEIELPGTAPR